MIIVVALLLEASILKYVNDRNAHRTSKVLLDRVITVLDKNDESRNEEENCKLLIELIQIMETVHKPLRIM